MKKIAIFIFILLSFILISCNDDGSGSTEKGYVDPGDWTGKDVNTKKAYNFKNYISSLDCSGDKCNAIIYQNKLNDTSYVGIAVNNSDTANPPTFSLKIYWESTTIPEGSVILESTQYKIKLIANNKTYTKTNDGDITMNIDYNSEHNTYDIDITSNIIFTDNDGNTFDVTGDPNIKAVKYP